MATSGTFTGSRGGNAYGPWLELDWARQQIDIPNNRSLIRLTLRLHADRTIRFTASKTGNLHGSSFTYTGGMTSPGSKVLRTRDVWVNHNSDGSKSQSFSASFNIAISWGGSQLNSISVSGVANITAIPRASTLSAFSFASNLKPDTAVNLNYTIDRKSDNFRHQIQLRDGSHVVRTWDNVSSDGSSTVQLSTANVNSLLNRMSSVTSRSLTLRVATRSGVSGGWIGSAVTRNATATVDGTVKPSVSALTVSQTGNAVSTHTLQGFSKIESSFTRSAGYGASLSSSSITIRRKGNNDDVQIISSDSGTTGRAIAHSGTYQAQGMARDSRGRTTYTGWIDFPVTAYRGPKITNFSADRSSSTPTTVNITRATTHTVLGTSNHLAYSIQRRQGTGSWSNVSTGATGSITTSGATGSASSTGNVVTTSYEFRLVVTDKFGESATATLTVSTQRVVLDIHKNEGVGIGKIREKGVLDVDGGAYFKGDLFVNEANLSSAQDILTVKSASEISDTYAFWRSLPQGTYFVSGGGTIPNQPSSFGIMVHSTPTQGASGLGTDVNTIWYTQPKGTVYRKSGNSMEMTGWVPMDQPERGTNGNGDYVKFLDGTLICSYYVSHGVAINTELGSLYAIAFPALEWTYPHSFVGTPYVDGRSLDFYATGVINQSISTTKLTYRPYHPVTTTASNAKRFNLVAIGRWK